MRPLPVIATLLAALVLLVVIGLRLLARDRDALFERYGQQRELAVTEAARAMEEDVADIGEDLDLASTLLQNAESTQLSERELHAIATIKREYLVMYARVGDEPITRVVASDVSPSVENDAMRATMEKMLAAAAAEPGKLHASEAFESGEKASWYRVYARRPVEHGPAVAVSVDMSIMLARLKLSRDASSRLSLLDARGEQAALSDRELAAAMGGDGGPLHDAIATARGHEATMLVVGGDVARAMGLPPTDAVVIAVPLTIDAGPPCVLVVAASTVTIQSQEQTLVRRVLVGGALVLVLLLTAAAYVIRSSYRARELRARLANADRLAHLEKLATAGQLAAGIAHEVGTPLNVARGRVELTLSHIGKEHDEASNQQVVIEQIDRVTRLLQQLLDYVRPAPASVQDIDVARTLQAAVDLLHAQAAKRKVNLVVEAASPLGQLKADPDQVQQIIVNLVLNAIDAYPQGGTVTLRALARGATLVVEIADTGQGIPRELQKQVFDPFFTTKKRGQGTGLGLWVVAQLVRAQSAEIELDSAPGQGTTVRVAWPVAA